MPIRRSQTPPKPIEAIIHRDARRLNIPTEELRGFVREEEEKAGTLSYPRNTALDPQLVWKGKDAQDSQPLSVPVVPIYIQEKISPQALIEDIRSGSAKSKARQTTLFAEFNGIEFDKLVDFYHHDQNWSNRMVLGDSLLVMTSLAEKEGLRGKVQAIYFDPPYGINFDSNWQVSTRSTVVKDGKVEDASRQPEQIKAFRDTWELGIHSYLSYLRDRLAAARDLLTESGSLFLQTGSENLHLIQSVMDEVFGRSNFVAIITYRTRTMPLQTTLLDVAYDHILWYAKDKDTVKFRPLFVEQSVEGDTNFRYVELPNGKRQPLTPEEHENHSLLPEGSRVYRLHYLKPTQYRKNQDFNFKFNGEELPPPGGNVKDTPDGKHSWATTPDGMARLVAASRIEKSGSTLQYVLFHGDYPVTRIGNVWVDSAAVPEKTYVVQTSELPVERCLLMTTDPGDLVLDPTCGSGTTAVCAERWGRRWITIDTSRVALALARTRLMSAKYPFFLLADSTEGIAKEAEILGHPTGASKPGGDIKKGFVYEKVPHVTLSSIANNPEISPGIGRKELREAITRYSEMELLRDQPYEDSSRIRVSGPFTVESLSPHRVIGPAEPDEPGKGVRVELPDNTAQFVTSIIENLRKAGVQNTVKAEHLSFSRLDIYPGALINAEGEYLENDITKRVAICIGPEHGTVGPELLKEAAKEAVQGRGFDLLVVCGFAFDPYVSEEAKHYGRLTVLVTRMNPDLTIGPDLLKKTGTGNLFMVFGEPDLDKKVAVDGTTTIMLKGLDVYDPTTGQIRSSSTQDIACWFVDTEYNGESFFVRQAYFCGDDEPYERLKRSLRAEIDESAWQSIYSTTSRPIPRPKTGKIAVKVINRYGDEVLKVLKI